MTKFTIGKDNSVLTTATDADAFEGGSAKADQLVVEAGGYLFAEGNNSSGVSLDNTGGWALKIDGSVSSLGYFGIHLTAGNGDQSTIDIGREAAVGGYVGIYAESGVTIRNQGYIPSDFKAAIEVDGDDRHELINEGGIFGPYSFLSENGASVDVVRNSGTMSGYLSLGEGDDSLKNTNHIEGDPTKTYVDLGGGDDRLINLGRIRIDVLGASGDDSVSNGGTIDARVQLGYGDDVLKNVIKVDGRMTSGVVTQEIDLGEGDDRLEGGKFAEDYHDGGGRDVAVLAGGNDIYRATTNGIVDGRDRIDACNGTDTYDANDAINSVYINLDSVKHEMSFGFGPPKISAGTAIGEDIAGARSDRILGFENVHAGTSDDIVFGSKEGNVIEGGDGMDALFGLGGNDRLIGSFGEDFIDGGTGQDILIGGSNVDHFIFTSVKDSAVSALRRDRINDFEDGVDIIDLSGIDAMKGRGNQAFEFIGSDVAFTGKAGEIRTYQSGNGQVIEADVDGDEVADFSIAVADGAKSIVFTAADFQL